MAATENIITKLRGLQVGGEVAAFSVTEVENDQPRIWLSWVGPLEKKINLVDFIRAHPQAEGNQQQQEYYFLGDELRPGSGLIRVFGGKSEGPGGTLTCLLTSKDGQDAYFVAAGHVLTDFWRDVTGQGSIYRYRKGFPPTGSTRFLGKVLYLPKDLPEPIYKDNPGPGAVLDVGIVKLDGDAELKQRTTCYGGFGECHTGECSEVEEGKRIVKCGSQETHWTEAVVWQAKKPEVVIYGPKKTRYVFRDQIILRDLKRREALVAKCPSNPVGTPFAVPGDSGTIVVDKVTKRPVGMLIAGSVLDGLYVVTPFGAIQKFFDQMRLVMQRA